MTIALLVGSVPGTIVGTLLLPAIAAGLATAATLAATRSSDTATKRREGYADAVSTLVAWIEFPYRIRRRVDDKPETLAGLANIGHELQERLASHEAWITAEHPSVAGAFQAARGEMGRIIGPCAKEAWTTGPITAAAEMNIGDWGPGRDCAPHVQAFQEVVKTRFGWCRVETAAKSARTRLRSLLPGG